MAQWPPYPDWGEVWTATLQITGQEVINTGWNTNKENLTNPDFSWQATVYLHGGSESFGISSHQSGCARCDGQYHINHCHLLQRFLQKVEIYIWPRSQIIIFSASAGQMGCYFTKQLWTWQGRPFWFRLVISRRNMRPGYYHYHFQVSPYTPANLWLNVLWWRQLFFCSSRFPR